jgi:hypothetical protein
MAVFEIAANEKARARRVGQEEIQPTRRRDGPAVEAQLEALWWAQPVARNRLREQTQAPWPPRWPARGASRARPPTHELVLGAARVQAVVRALVLMRAVAEWPRRWRPSKAGQV